MNLLDNQKLAIEKLQKYNVGALFMKPGAGKTRVACELIKDANPDYVLWLTPFQTKENLANEIRKWDYQFPQDIVGIESLSNSDQLYLKCREKLKKASNSYIIMDESLKIKNKQALRTQRAIKLSSLANYKLIMNGTPLSRNILDLWSQLEFLSPKILNLTFSQFKKTFCEYVTITQLTENTKQSMDIIKKYHNLEYLYKLITPFIFSSSIDLKIDWHYIRHDYSIDESLLNKYYELKEDYLKKAAAYTIKINFLEMSQVMQHCYCLASEKFTITESLIAGKEDSTIIFCKYKRSEEALQKAFPNVKVTTFAKSSYGLNLQAYNQIIYFDKTFDYSQRDQSERRIYRTGQNQDCYYHDLSGNVGLDHIIDTNISKKTNLLNEIKKELAQKNSFEVIMNAF
ncbi:DEAD/DEAH box helicase [Listeria seeligeri]|uniref:DEAD/DEAH box helicase n=1 Tax=Listeria seeligeri TaxID=1640 RepID=UPI001629BC53|nr:DEAD/DEAH box helicase [Listeria seeligeri]MBC1576494.1 DEAD/DEAH box helicase [Listeria seeligeri]MBC1580765.1 DEAD/DEAH box helicase [Listeria seeligeri]MBC1584391.1 DEAD/DEAH box helicase [Listeria seeligeri]MBC1592733.1 DEAD/DEAH box helicase [Listeria seeligeri]MBC1595357.1 DEAD/DEAH box helicase [Listeria seeligeri]